jgi:hypothetical protein
MFFTGTLFDDLHRDGSMLPILVLTVDNMLVSCGGVAVIVVNQKRLRRMLWS